MKMTPWYPGTVKPVRDGYYQRRLNGKFLLYKAYWDGVSWRSTDCVGYHQNLPWRGVTK